MSTEKKIIIEKNPYVVLGVPYGASETQIRKAYHEIVRSNDPERLSEASEAYQKIYNKENRLRYKWLELESFVATPPVPQVRELDEQGRENIIKELAFLNSWELGEDF